MKLIKSPVKSPIKSPIKSYDNLARCYGWLERAAFGGLLTRVRIDVLKDLLEHLQTRQQTRQQAEQRVLILGEGDGRFLQRFSHESRVACEVDCVDNSAAMLTRAKARLTSNSLLEVNFIHADVTRGIPTDRQYDAVVSVFFLDNFAAETLEHLTYDIMQRLSCDGRWYVADFREGTIAGAIGSGCG